LADHGALDLIPLSLLLRRREVLGLGMCQQLNFFPHPCLLEHSGRPLFLLLRRRKFWRIKKAREIIPLAFSLLALAFF